MILMPYVSALYFRLSAREVPNMASSVNPMSRVLDLARLAAAAGEVPVGALVFDPLTDEIIAEAHNAPIEGHDPTAHAEILALRRAGQRRGNYRLNGLHLYVSLEPCAMCAGAISLARISKLIFAACDPKGGAVLHGPRFFDQPTCHWKPEIEQDAAAGEISSEMLRDFFKGRR
jgi:tRNA(adenine34) deaminase